MNVTQLAQMVARANPDVRGLLVVDADGRVEANADASVELVKTAGALALELRGLLARTSRELGCGELKTTVVEGHDAAIALANVDEARTVVLIGSKGAPTDGLRADLLWVADFIRKERIVS